MDAYDNVEKEKIIADMANCRVLKESAPKSKWARHVLLPDDPAKDSSFSCSSGRISIYAHVSKARGRDRGQDVAMVIAEGKRNVVGVFDGYGDLGDDIHVELAGSMCGLWPMRSDTVNDRKTAEAFIHDSARLTTRKLEEMYKDEEEEPADPETTPIDSPYARNRPYGGTTAILVFMFPDGRFVASGVGDSACYAVGPNGEISRMFTSGWMNEDPLEAMDAEKYANLRNILEHSVTWGGISVLETEEGMLEKGGMLILASDGITKNLAVMTDEDGDVCETSGCQDIGNMLRGKKGAEKAAGAILETVRKIAGYPSGIRNPIEKPGNRVLLPANDDLSLVVVHRKA